jgi:DNA-cytosine methyltransferase
MDTPQTITHVSLCAGYGGIDLGLKRAIPDLRTIAFSEIEGYACANLVAKMEAGFLDAAPIWTNLKTFPWADFSGKVDIISGGYPCQPFSAAGKRLGTEDPRHLWPFIADGIRLMQPRVCFFENVEGHISLGLRAVIEELGSLGYKTTWGVFSASEVGAPHQRKRIFILAHLIDERLQGRVCGRTYQEWKDFNGYAGCGGAGGGIWPSRPGQPQYGWEPPRVVGNAGVQESRRLPSGIGRKKVSSFGQSSDNVGNAAEQRLSELGCGEIHESRSVEELKRPDQIVGDTESQRPTTQRAKHEGLSGELCATSASSENIIGDRQIKPSLGGDADGSTSGMDYAELCVTCDNRTDELRLLGNGVVPDTATRAFLILVEELNESPSLSTSSR